MSECYCNLQKKLVGDGCEVCNPAKALEYAKETIEELTQRCDMLLEALWLVLPMAKGYAAANRVGSNADNIRIAEDAIADAEGSL